MALFWIRGLLFWTHGHPVLRILLIARNTRDPCVDWTSPAPWGFIFGALGVIGWFIGCRRGQKIPKGNKRNQKGAGGEPINIKHHFVGQFLGGLGCDPATAPGRKSCQVLSCQVPIFHRDHLTTFSADFLAPLGDPWLPFGPAGRAFGGPGAT